MEEFKREIRCSKKDDNFGRVRDVEYSCRCRFIIGKEDIYAVNSIDYSSESMTEYYAICPLCGRINKVNEDMLTEDVKEDAILKYKLEPFQYQKNNLRSELIYLDMISPPKMKTRTK